MFHFCVVLLLTLALHQSLSHPVNATRNIDTKYRALHLSKRSHIAGQGECSWTQRAVIAEILDEAQYWTANARSDAWGLHRGARFSMPDNFEWMNRMRVLRDEVFIAFFGFSMTRRQTPGESVVGRYIERRFHNVHFETWRGDQGQVLIRCDTRGSLGCRRSDLARFASGVPLPHIGQRRTSGPYPTQIILVFSRVCV